MSIYKPFTVSTENQESENIMTRELTYALAALSVNRISNPVTQIPEPIQANKKKMLLVIKAERCGALLLAWVRL